MPHIAYIGCNSPEPEAGIHCLSVNEDTGELTFIGKTDPFDCMPYLAISQNSQTLYCGGVDQNASHNLRGAVLSFEIMPDYSLKRVDTQPVFGSKSPCYISLSKDEKHLYTSNYTEGSFSCYNVSGTLLSHPTHTIVHTGTPGPNPKRQSSPYAHCVESTPDGKLVCVADLGLDAIKLYTHRPDGTLEPKGELACPPGSGPRHISFGQNGRFMYVVCEMGNVICVFSYNDGKFEHIQTITTMPKEDAATNSAAIRFSPDKKLLFASNRYNSDNIAVYKVDDNSGLLTCTQYAPSSGLVPRDLEPTPDGKFLLVCNQDSNTVNVLKIDSENGKLEPTLHSYGVKLPVCVRFLKG